MAWENHEDRRGQVLVFLGHWCMKGSQKRSSLKRLSKPILFYDGFNSEGSLTVLSIVSIKIIHIPSFKSKILTVSVVKVY